MTDSLSSKLKKVAKAVDAQQQFLIISGLDPGKYTNEERVILHAGLSSHIGSKRGMSGRQGGDMTVLRKYSNSENIVRRDLIERKDHIVAMSTSSQGSTQQYHGPPNQPHEIVSSNKPSRIIQNANQTPQPFHTDHGDLVSFFTLSTSQKGGALYLADTTAVYNDLKAFKPKLAQALLDDWIMTR